MSRGASPFPATPPGVTPAVSRPDTAGPAPDPFGRDGPKRVARAPNPNLTRRPLSPPDRRLASELQHHGREGSPSGYTPPAHQRQGGFTPSRSGLGLGSDPNPNPHPNPIPYPNPEP